MPNFRMGDPPEPLFTGANLGGLCETCGKPIPAGLAGVTTHPTCDPDWPALLVAHKRRIAQRDAAARLAATTPPKET